MGIFEHGPYTNYHEQNIDYIAERINSVLDDVKHVKNVIDELQYNYAIYNKKILEIENSNKEIIRNNEEFKRLINLQLKREAEKTTNEIRTVKEEFNKLKSWAVEKLENIGNNILIYNSLTGEYSTLDEIINMIVNNMNKGGMSLNELGAKHMTIAELDALNLSVYDFDWKLKEKLQYIE